MDHSTIRAGLAAAYDGTLVDELLQAYSEAKRNYYLGGLRLSAVEGGRFCEAALRMLQQRTSGSFQPLGKTLDTEKLIRDLSNLPSTAAPDSVRLHIPRALRVVYDIRTKRDAAHLVDDIDPNLQDATLVTGILDWVLAEFVRLHHTVTPNGAQRIVEDLVTRHVPVIQEFSGFLKVLNPRLVASDHLLVLLYQRGMDGALYADLDNWARPKMRSNLRRTLKQLTDRHALVHFDGERYYVTLAGIREVESRRLYSLGGDDT
jgi:hypothetical protein